MAERRRDAARAVRGVRVGSLVRGHRRALGAAASRRRSRRSPSRWSRRSIATIPPTWSTWSAWSKRCSTIPADPQRPAATRPRRRDGPHEGRGRGVRGAHGACSTAITWPQPLAELIDGVLRHVPGAPPVDRGRAVAEVDRFARCWRAARRSPGSSAATASSAARAWCCAT